MAKVKAKAADAPSTSKELKDTLWKAADKLRGSMDASQYRDVVLGLVFLKYVSDAFDERREELAAELASEPDDFISETLEEQDEYTGSGCSAPRECRWEYLAKHAKGIPASASNDAQSIGNLIDEAMRGLMDANESLRGVLPTMYGRENVDQRRLGNCWTCSTPPVSPGGERPRRATCLARCTSISSTSSPRRRASGWRVLHAAVDRPDPGRSSGTALRAGVRPMLRVRRHVRAGREIPGTAP